MWMLVSGGLGRSLYPSDKRGLFSVVDEEARDSLLVEDSSDDGDEVPERVEESQPEKDQVEARRPFDSPRTKIKRPSLSEVVNSSLN